MVALSHATARELGYDPSVDADRPFVEVSGRKGLGVKADDLLDRLTEKAAARGREAQRRICRPRIAARIAEAIAVAAVRYFMVKFSRGKVIVFDIDEALSFEGESGPYLQYAVVRANNIFAQAARSATASTSAGVLAALDRTPADALTGDIGRVARALGAGARGGAARRGRRPGGADAGVVGAGEVRVRPGAGVQRLLPSVLRSSTRSATTSACGGRRRSPTTARS